MFGLGPIELSIPLLFMLFWLGIIVYILSLANRAVKALEKIADKLENMKQ